MSNNINSGLNIFGLSGDTNSFTVDTNSFVVGSDGDVNVGGSTGSGRLNVKGNALNSTPIATFSNLNDVETVKFENDGDTFLAMNGKATYLGDFDTGNNYFRQNVQTTTQFSSTALYTGFHAHRNGNGVGIFSSSAGGNSYIPSTGRMLFLTDWNNNAASVSATLAMTIDVNQNVGIGLQTTILNADARLEIIGSGDADGYTFMTRDSGDTITTVIEDGGNVGIGASSPTAKLNVVGNGVDDTLLIESSTNQDLLTIEDDGATTFNQAGLNTADFTIEGDTDTFLFKTNASENSVGIGIAGDSTSKLHVDAINETRTYIGRFNSNTATNGVLIVAGNPAANSFGLSASAKCNGNFIATGVNGESTGGAGQRNRGTYGRAGNASTENVGVYGIDTFGHTGATLSAGVYGFGQGKSPSIHGVYGATGGGQVGSTTTIYALRGRAGSSISDVTIYGVHSEIAVGGSITGTTGYAFYSPTSADPNNSRYGLVIQGTNDYSGLGTIAPTDMLHVNGITGSTQFRLQKSYTPTGSGDTAGNVGSIAWDDTYMYTKTNTGWGRSIWDYAF